MALILPGQLLRRLSQIFRRGHVNMQRVVTEDTAAAVQRQLALAYPYWIVVGSSTRGWWACSAELDVPSGCVPTLSADTADQLKRLLDEQERRRGRSSR
jgi:hypothetical protein